MLTPGGSNTVHIYTQTVQQYSTHLHTSSTAVQYLFTHKQYTIQHNETDYTNHTTMYIYIYKECNQKNIKEYDKLKSHISSKLRMIYTSSNYVRRPVLIPRKISGCYCQVMTCRCRTVSTGSGSGSSGGVGSGVSMLQHLAKQPSLTSNISPKTTTCSSYYFSSLPRGILGGYNSLSRPATLPRQPLQQLLLDGYSNSSSGDSKRNSDSVLFQRLFHPLPACDPAVHSGSGFHDVFDAARDPSCKLRSLNVSKCLLGAEDALCLG
jgi:hypothetical protein